MSEWIKTLPFSWSHYLAPQDFGFTHGIHPLSKEGHHRVGSVAHEHALVVDVIRGTLDGHHGLGRQAEEVPLQCVTMREKKKQYNKNDNGMQKK